MWKIFSIYQLLCHNSLSMHGCSDTLSSSRNSVTVRLSSEITARTYYHQVNEISQHGLKLAGWRVLRMTDTRKSEATSKKAQRICWSRNGCVKETWRFDTGRDMVHEAWRINKNSNSQNQSVIKKATKSRGKKKVKGKDFQRRLECASRGAIGIFSFPRAWRRLLSLKEFRVIVDSSPDMQALYIPRKILQC